MRRRDIVEHLCHVFAESSESAAATRAGAGHLMVNVDARQPLRQRSARRLLVSLTHWR
jgi:hypothetical protein